MPLEELIEAEQASWLYHQRRIRGTPGHFRRDIKENQGKPNNDRQKRKWGRWLGKALEAGKKFTGERLEKGIDTGIGEVVKKWINNNGLDQLKTMIETIMS